jgi:lysophospholipase L1-like esterase
VQPPPVLIDPPTISCPAGQAVSVPAVPATVTYALPVVVGGTAPASIVCSPTSGSSFPAGSTPVSCTVTDSRAKTDSCIFTVTVEILVPRISMTRYVAFGDSTTEGKPGPARYYPGVSQFPTAYAQVLYNLMVQRYTGQALQIEMFNEGFAGECVQAFSTCPAVDGVTRLPGVLNADAPQVLLLQEGANDLSGGDPNAPLRVADGLRTMVRLARNRGITVFIGTILPQRPGGRRAGGASLVVATNDRIRQLAASEGATLVDLHAAFGGSADPWIDLDGLHPNVAGYQKIAETFFAAIRSRFEVVATPASAPARSPRRGVGLQ